MLNIIDNNRDYNYEFILCRPNKKQIAVLSEAFNTSYKCEFKNIDELDFDIPYNVTDSDFNIIKNENWDLIISDYLILMEVKDNDTILHRQYFTINTPKLIGGDKETLHVHGYSLEYLISKKKLREFQGTRQLYKSVGDTVEIGDGILNLLTSVTNWKIGYIDPQAINEEISSQSHRKYRTFNVTEKTWLDFIRSEVELSFGCILDFDTDLELINIYAIDNYGQNQGLYLSEDNYLKTINWSVESDNIVTQLSVYGLDNLGISSVNVTGEAYVEDYTPYRNLDYMEQDLLDAMDVYDGLLSANVGVYAGYLTQLGTLNDTNTGNNSNLVDLKSQLQVLLDTRDGNIVAGTSLTEINILMAVKNVEIFNKINEIASVQTSIDGITLAITTLKTLLLKENNFTPEQLKSLVGFQRQETWSNVNYFDVNSLYAAGKKALTIMNEPVIVVDIDSVSFIDCAECQDDWNKLKNGDIINVEYRRWNKYIQCRLIGYTHDIDKCSLKLTLSNKNYKLDAENYIGQISSTTSTSATTIAVSKSNWDYASSAYDEVTTMKNAELDTALRQIVCSRNQGITIDERGINLKNTTNPLEQMKLINNLLVMTTDNFATVATAISPRGIVADTLIGHAIAGNKLQISDTAGTVTIDGNGLNINEARTDGKARIKLNSTDGFSIENNIKKVFSVDTNGNLVANDMTANNINAVNGVITGATIQTANPGMGIGRIVLNANDFSGYNSAGSITSKLTGTDLSFYFNGAVVGSLKGVGNCMQIDLHNSAQFVITSNGLNELVFSNGQWDFYGTITNGGAVLATQDYVQNYVAQHQYIPPSP